MRQGYFSDLHVEPLHEDMRMLKRLLVQFTDRASVQSIIRHAVEISEAHEASVTAQAVLDPASLEVGPVPLGAGDSARELLEHRTKTTRDLLNEACDAFRQACESRRLTFDIVHEQGNAWEMLADRARYHDLTITGQRNVLHHGVLPESDVELLHVVRSGVRPIMAVPPEYREIQRVMICYSDSAESAQTMKRFIQFNLFPQAQVRMITLDYHESVAAHMLESAASYCATHKRKVEIDHVAGRPQDQVLAYAEGWNADLIVLGSSARSYWARKIFGETTQRVLEEATCAMFLY
jgi:nucleotide-binding universal stress UspA family protein